MLRKKKQPLKGVVLEVLDNGWMDEKQLYRFLSFIEDNYQGKRCSFLVVELSKIYHGEKSGLVLTEKLCSRIITLLSAFLAEDEILFP